jgi:uncharacterized protein (TIGR00266 family)
VESRISGTTLPVLEIDLQPGDKIFAETGEMSWMSAPIEMNTTTQAGGGGGLFGAVKRAVGGGGLFMTEFTSRGGVGLVAFAAKVPGQILPIEVRPGQSYLIHRSGFTCAVEGVTVTVGFQRKLGAGIFGGEGFVMQKIGGSGHAWVELDGEVTIYDLKAGETMRVDPGHVGMFEEQVKFDITMMKGFKNMIFGGEGLFLATLTGPGRIWLQSLPLSSLASALAPYLPSHGSTGSNVAAGGIAGAALGGLFGGGKDD